MFKDLEIFYELSNDLTFNTIFSIIKREAVIYIIKYITLNTGMEEQRKGAQF